MKKYIVLLLTTFLLFVVSCKSDSYDVEDELENSEDKILNIKTDIESVNIDIKNIDALIKGQEEKLQIVSLTELDDKSGYQIITDHGSNIMLKNKTNSLVGVKMFTDGYLYWTINRQFIFDGNYKMIKAIGVLPKLRINIVNEWEISSDEGKTWSGLFDENNNLTVAIGDDEKSTGLKFEEKENIISIIYKGDTYNVKKFIRPKLAIEYIAKYNVSLSGLEFAKTHDNYSSGLFNWYEAFGVVDAEYNPENKKITDNRAFQGYHLGSQSEWRGILPDNVIDWSGNNQENVTEEISIAGSITIFKADYDLKAKKKVCYALRFKSDDNSMLSAYRYEYVNIPFNTELSSRSSSKLSCEYYNKMIRVKALYLGKNKAKTTMNEISNDAFWSNSEESYITRVFPATGYSAFNKNGEISRSGEQGFYWTDTDNGFFNGVGYAVSMNFYQRYVSLTKNAYNEKRDKYAVRLFRNK